MGWLADNATKLYILLAIIAAGFVVAWRFSGRNKQLLGALGAILILGLIFLLAQFATSDSKILEANVKAMADAVVDGKPDDLFKHISADFHYKTMTRDMLYAGAQREIRARRVSDIRISQFHVEEVSRAKNRAQTRFQVTIQAQEARGPYMFVTEADFVLEGNDWKLKTMRFKPAIGNQDQEIELPGLR